MPPGPDPTPTDVLLDNLRVLSDELGHAPTPTDVDKYCDHGVTTYQRRFPTYTTALAQAGIMPQSFHPLTDDQIHQFNQTALSKRPRDALPAMFFQFLPVPVRVYLDFNPEWTTTLADEHVLRVPPEFSPNTERLEIKMPSTWTNPVTAEEEQTQLTSLLEWWFTNHESSPQESRDGLNRALQRVAADADLTHRPMVTGNHRKTVPRVTPKDLHHTHGIHLARNGASKELIARRMGLDRAEKAEFYFALLEHHDRY